MALQNFVDGTGPTINASWLNQVDAFVNTLFGGATTPAAALSAIGGVGANSPAFTGTPTAPTAVNGTNNTQIATTAFVTNAFGVVTAANATNATNAQNMIGGLAGQHSFQTAPNVSGFQYPPSNVGYPTNLKIYLSAASTSVSITADEVVVATAFGQSKAVITSFAGPLNINTVGAGGMDTGAAPTNGFIAIYAIAQANGASPAVMATNATTSSGQIYSGLNMPAGYTMSSLLAIWPTNATPAMVAGMVWGTRKFHYQTFPAAFTAHATISAATPISLTGVPVAAKTVSLLAGTTASSTGILFTVAGDATGIGGRAMGAAAAGATTTVVGGSASMFGICTVMDIVMTVAQTIQVITMISSGSTNNLYVIDYTW